MAITLNPLKRRKRIRPEKRTDSINLTGTKPDRGLSMSDYLKKQDKSKKINMMFQKIK